MQIYKNHFAFMENQNLKLLEQEQPEEKPKKLTWLQERINDFLKGFQDATGRKCPIPYAQLVGMLATKANNAVGGWATVSEDEKEIIPGYPDMDVWIEQREAFFRDEFAASKAGFGFGYFLKQFGTFVKYAPIKRQPSDPILHYECKCGHKFDVKKSELMRYKDKTLGCKKCLKPYNVNEILNQPQSLKELLP